MSCFLSYVIRADDAERGVGRPCHSAETAGVIDALVVSTPAGYQADRRRSLVVAGHGGVGELLLGATNGSHFEVEDGVARFALMLIS